MRAWRLEIADEAPGFTGSIQLAELTLFGIPLIDSDADGLDDRWELAHFGSLNQGPKDDPDHDGYSNAREQARGTSPNTSPPLLIDYSIFSSTQGRLSWPANG